MKRILEFVTVFGVVGVLGSGCLERKSEEVPVEVAQATAGVVAEEEAAEEAPEVDGDAKARAEEDAKVAAAIAAAKAKRMEAMDPKAPIGVALGLQADGSVIVEWKEGLNYAVKNEGSANDAAGATVLAKFGNRFDGFDLTLDLVVKVAGEKMVVSGTYDTTVPFQVTLLGSGETSDKAEGLSGEAGSGPFEYEGAVPVFFEVLRKE